MRPRKLTEEADRELQTIAELKVRIPPYKQIADRYGVTVQTIRQRVSEMTRATKRAKDMNVLVPCGTSDEKIGR